MEELNKPTELEYLIDLLDDPDESIHSMVRTRIREMGLIALGPLRAAYISSSDKLRNKRLLSLIEDIRFNEVLEKFTYWCRAGFYNIAEFLSIIAQYENPQLTNSQLVKQLQNIVFDVKQEMAVLGTPYKQIRIINHVLFGVHRFRPNTIKPFSTENYLIDKVLKKKTGSDSILALLYLYVSDQLGLPIKPVDFPRNQLLCYINPESEEGPESKLFYINPYNKGVVLSEKDIRFYMHQMKERFEHKYLETVNIPKTGMRMLHHLREAYKQAKEHKKERDINELLQVMNQYFKFFK